MYQFNEIWQRIRIFVMIWVGGLIFLVAASVIRYWSFISTVLKNNVLALVNGIMPSVIMLAAIVWIIRSMFR